nr:src substrate cortactin-like isoform X5 [Cavia porcellus]XP_023417594.1 src substrate cortactin-like isoform X5 [Cavia porcellus]
MSSISSRQKQHKGNQMEILCNLIYASLIKNDVSKKEQRWGSKTLQGSRHQEHINIYKIRENVFQEHHTLKEKELQTGPKASHGYGGKFCVEQYSMDKSAVGHEYQLKLAKHCSQVDSVRGFGGKFGVQMDRVDQSASTFEGVAQVSSAY